MVKGCRTHQGEEEVIVAEEGGGGGGGSRSFPVITSILVNTMRLLNPAHLRHDLVNPSLHLHSARSLTGLYGQHALHHMQDRRDGFV